MKKTLLIFIILLLCSCTYNSAFPSYGSERFVRLCDYKNLSVDYTFTQITEKDVENIIAVELSSAENFIEVTDRTVVCPDDILLISYDTIQEYYYLGNSGNNLILDQSLLNAHIGDSIVLNAEDFQNAPVTLEGIFRAPTVNDLEFVLSYYGFATYNDLDSYIRRRASDEIIFNYAYDVICQNSVVIDVPSELQDAIDSDRRAFQEELLQFYPTIDDYLIEVGLNSDEFDSQFTSFYYELMIYKAILDNESVIITKNEISNYRNDHLLSSEYTDYEIYSMIAEPMVREILIRDVKVL